MSERNIEPLAPGLDDLLGAERSAPEPPDRIARRVHGRVRATVAIAAGAGTAAAGAKAAGAAASGAGAGTAAAGATGGTAAVAIAKPVVIAVAAVGASAGIGAGTRALVDTDPPPAPRPVPVIEQRARPEPAAPMPRPEPAVLPVLDAGIAEPDAAVVQVAAPRIDEGADAGAPALTLQTLAEERTLVAAARADLEAGAPDAALTALEQHAGRFPDGLLAEERDALRVQALAAAGRHGAAGRRAAAFLSRYPDSIHRTAVERVRTQEESP